MVGALRVICAAIIILASAECRGSVEAKLVMKPQRIAVLAEVKGTVEVKPATDKAVWVAGKASTSLLRGDEIITGKDSKAVIHINGDPESIRVELEGESRLTIVELVTDALTKSKGTLLSLGIGKATVRTRNMTPGSSLEIKTPTSIVSSRGVSSSFSVQVEHPE